MILEAEKQGLLKPGGLIVEATAGNTGIGLAIIAKKKGYNISIIVPDKMAVEKIYHLRSLGAEVIVTRSDIGKGHPEYYVDLAKTISIERGGFYINQFSNTANLDSHYNEIGPEIFEQLDGNIDAFVAGVGTGGTLSGVGKFMKEKIKNFELVLADPKGSLLKEFIDKGSLQSEAGSWIVEGIGEDFVPELLEHRLIDHAFSISDKEAVATCHELLQKEGVLAGSSSGTLIAAAIQYCRKQKSPKRVVTLVCDAGDKYLRKIYSEAWLRSEGLQIEKKNNDLTDVINFLAKSNSAPILVDSTSIDLAFKIIRELGIGALAVKNNNGSILGVIRQEDILNAVHKNSIGGSINNYIYNCKKFDISSSFESLLGIILKDKHALMFDREKFLGVVDCMDLISYIRKNEREKNEK